MANEEFWNKVDGFRADLRIVPGLEVRMEGEGESTLVGVGAPFNRWSRTLGFGDFTFRETIRPGAFGKTLMENRDILSTIDHDFSRILGRTSSGTLTLRESEAGLVYEVQLGGRSYESDLRESIRRGDIFGSSFMFRAVKGKVRWKAVSGGPDERELFELRLFETGPVVSPAYTDSSTGVRSLGRLGRQGLSESEERQYLRSILGQEGPETETGESGGEEPVDSHSEGRERGKPDPLHLLRQTVARADLHIHTRGIEL